MNYFIHVSPAPFGCPEADGLTKLQWSYKETEFGGVYDVVDTMTTLRTKTITAADDYPGDGSNATENNVSVAIYANFYIVGCPRTVNLSISAAGDTVSATVVVYNEDTDTYTFSDTGSLSESVDITYDGACPLQVYFIVEAFGFSDTRPSSYNISVSFTITP